jgi:hypothetical protein
MSIPDISQTNFINYEENLGVSYQNTPSRFYRNLKTYYRIYFWKSGRSGNFLQPKQG